ncbi:hypothetical protein AB4176_04860 [Vibrio splendidus]
MNGNYTDWDELDVILRAYRYAMILAERKGELLRTDETKATSQEVTFVH